MPIDISSDFFAVDELIQVIYQGNLKFVVIFKVTRTAWTIHVALDKTERWWAGQWTPSDVDEFLVRLFAREPLDAETRLRRDMVALIMRHPTYCQPFFSREIR